MHENDIINFLSDYLQGKGNEFNVYFNVVDEEGNLPSGATAKHIETAASESGFDVVRKGETSIRLRKKPRSFAVA
ncbi:MAG TPA: hypothetical protein VF596_01200 [Pyrinomonadaceae bacterium]|jgi:hypothetical protein